MHNAHTQSVNRGGHAPDPSISLQSESLQDSELPQLADGGIVADSTLISDSPEATGTLPGVTSMAGLPTTFSPSVDYWKLFQMPKAVKIMGRTSSITNSFINSIIPVVRPTVAEIHEALAILDMVEGVTCSYCGDGWTEWDHLRPLVLDKQPTGYISEIHNLVPACGKCNQSKGNKDWRQWMFGPAARSPKTRGVDDLESRAERLAAYEAWRPPTVVSFADLAGPDLWNQHQANHRQLMALMREAEVTASAIRSRVLETYLLVSDVES